VSQDHRFLGSGVEPPQTFAALGSPGSGTYVGLETFPNPGCEVVVYSSDEVMAKCPITGQPDFYTVSIQLKGAEKLIESKSLKLWFQNLMALSFQQDFGIFCEALAVHIRDTIAEATETDEADVTVQLVQKSRGGISITAVA
jgi:7-cyano-7-deazaguanine reductase